MAATLIEHQARLLLNAADGLGPIAANRLIDHFGGAAQVLAASQRDLEATIGAPETARLLLARESFDVAREEARMAQAGIRFVMRADGDYPPLLGRISDPPLGFYAKGKFALNAPCVAIVGSRRASTYGLAVARDLAVQLANRGVCVVSGFSRGVDSAAHEGALAAGGRTAAVMPCGLDIIHPPENVGLYRRVEASGLLLSEFRLGRSPDPGTLEQRARVISGLCEAVIVVETDTRGGAMAVARFAADQGRLVAAVPGRIDQSLSAGCLQLIREGALMCTRSDDVLRELRYITS
jgi:DNA processing protein